MRGFLGKFSILSEPTDTQNLVSIFDDSVEGCRRTKKGSLDSRHSSSGASEKSSFSLRFSGLSRDQDDADWLRARETTERILNEQIIGYEHIWEELKFKYGTAVASTSALEALLASVKHDKNHAASKIKNESELQLKNLQFERNASKKAAIDASKASDSKFLDQKSRYETAATAAADASQLATEEAKVEANSRMEIERDASKQAAIDASEASDSKFLDQKSRYETAATAAAAASDIKFAVDHAAYKESISVFKELFAIEREDNTKSANHLELVAKSALLETEQLRNISANAAHDLKSPLHTLLVGLEFMRSVNSDNLNSSQDNRAMLDTLDSACAFMGSAISRTIDFSKSTNGVALIPSNSSFHLQSSLENPIKWVKAMIFDDSITVSLSPLPVALDSVITDKHWVEENLLCLLSNAVKYSSQGAISVSTTIQNDFIRISVQDSGIGVSAESKELLFKKYSKVQSMAVGSTGLGLYSLLNRCEAIGGSCGVNDREDKKQGSLFWFTFPYCPEIIESEQEFFFTNETKSTPLRSLRILIVDDSSAVVKILSKKLSALGHLIFSACNGADGLKLMIEMKNALDLVIMDIQMPVMDGIEATKRYRDIENENNDRKYLPIICSSANSSGNVKSLASSAGVDSFLHKPFTAAILATEIEKIFRKSLL